MFYPVHRRLNSSDSSESRRDSPGQDAGVKILPSNLTSRLANLESQDGALTDSRSREDELSSSATRPNCSLPPEVAATETSANRLNSQFPELDELSEQVGEFIHYWGFKRVHGRIWTHLFLAKRPMDAGELVTQMQISKALVSISLRELLDYEVIQEIGKSTRGTNLYQTNPDILAVIMSVLRQREKRMLSRISAAHESLTRTQLKHREEAGLCDQNLGQLKTLIERASGALDSFIALSEINFAPWSDSFNFDKNATNQDADQSASQTTDPANV